MPTDKERLDWLRDRMASGQFMYFDRRIGGWVKMNPWSSFRHEIDAAIRASKRGARRKG